MELALVDFFTQVEVGDALFEPNEDALSREVVVLIFHQAVTRRVVEGIAVDVHPTAHFVPDELVNHLVVHQIVKLEMLHVPETVSTVEICGQKQRSDLLVVSESLQNQQERAHYFAFQIFCKVVQLGVFILNIVYKLVKHES